MGRKPPCRICRSRRWRKSSLGFYICEFGHQLEGHQEEEGEFDVTAGGMRERRMSSKRKRKAAKAESLRGVDGENLALQAVQLILRKQLYALIHDLGFPPELELVAREYWTLYMSSLERYKDRWDGGASGTSNAQSEVDEGSEGTDNMDMDDDKTMTEAKDTTGDLANEPSHAIFKDKTKLSANPPDAVDQLQEYQSIANVESDDSDDSDENESIVEDDIEDIEDQEEDQVIREGGDTTGDELEDKTPKRRLKKRRERWSPVHLSMPFTIIICYLSALHLKIPVVLGDFYRWALHRKIPYYHATSFLPPEMAFRLPATYKMHLQPLHTQGTDFRKNAIYITRFFHRRFGLRQETLNLPPLVYRFTQELMLPVEVHACALELSHALFEDTLPIEMRMRRRASRRLLIFQSVRGPQQVMAAVVIVAKLFFGLDDKSRRTKDRLSWINTLPKEQAWMRSLDVFDALRKQTELPSRFGELEELIQVNPDLYSEYIKGEIRPDPATVLRDLMNLFQETDVVKQAEGFSSRLGASPSIESFIKQLHSNVSPPENNKDVEGLEMPPLEPADGYVHYNDDGAGEFIGNYGRLLSYASNVLHISADDMHNEVCFVEQFIGRIEGPALKFTPPPTFLPNDHSLAIK